MASSISPDFGGLAGGTPPPAVTGERGRIDLADPVGAGLRWELRDGVLRVGLHGEICAWAVERLQPIVLSLLTELQPWAILAELSGVTFLDASGVNLLIRVRQLAAEHGAQLTLESTSRVVRRVLALCELDGEFGVR